mgnify:CR=1 FL=1
MQKQIYLHFAEAKYLRRSQNTKKPGQTQPESDFIQAKSKIVKGERKRELVPCFPRRILSKTMSKIAKERKRREESCGLARTDCRTASYLLQRYG